MPVASLAMGHRDKCPIWFRKFCAFCSCWQLNLYKFRKLPKTNMYSIYFAYLGSITLKLMGRGGEETFMLSPSTHFLATPLFIAGCVRPQTPSLRLQYDPRSRPF